MSSPAGRSKKAGAPVKAKYRQKFVSARTSARDNFHDNTKRIYKQVKRKAGKQKGIAVKDVLNEAQRFEEENAERERFMQSRVEQLEGTQPRKGKKPSSQRPQPEGTQPRKGKKPSNERPREDESLPDRRDKASATKSDNVDNVNDDKGTDVEPSGSGQSQRPADPSTLGKHVGPRRKTIPKNTPFRKEIASKQQAAEEAAAFREEQYREAEERRKRNEKSVQRRKKKHYSLTRHNSKGQPIMQNQIEHLLSKLTRK